MPPQDPAPQDSLAQVRRALEPDPVLAEKTLSAKRSWEGKIFSVECQEVELSDGFRGYRELVRHHGGAGVVAVRDAAPAPDAASTGVAPAREVCLVRQYRVAIGRVTLEIPAGKLDPGETGAHAAARELAEETGLVAARLEPLVTTLGSPGFTDEHTEVFLATGLSQHEAAPDEGELVGVLWLPGDAVVAAILEGLVQDAKTVAGVLAARAAGML